MFRWFVGVLDGFGERMSRVEKGNKSSAKGPKITHCMEKRGTDHTFF